MNLYFYERFLYSNRSISGENYKKGKKKGKEGKRQKKKRLILLLSVC